MDILVNRKTNQVIYNVKKRYSHNRLGFGSVEYQGRTADGKKVIIPGSQYNSWIAGYCIGQQVGFRNDEVVNVEQVHKFTVIVTFKCDDSHLEKETLEGQKVEPEPLIFQLQL